MWSGDDGDKCEDFADDDADNDDEEATCSSTPPSHMFFSLALSQGKQTSIKKKAITGLHKVSTQR